jgi:hypothetical protein
MWTETPSENWLFRNSFYDGAQAASVHLREWAKTTDIPKAVGPAFRGAVAAFLFLFHGAAELGNATGSRDGAPLRRQRRRTGQREEAAVG